MKKLSFRGTVCRLLTLVFAIGCLAGARPDALRGSMEVAVQVGIQTGDPSAVIGSGPDREEVTCILCAGVILGAGSTTVFGLAMISGIFPEAVIGCAAVCVIAFT